MDKRSQSILDYVMLLLVVIAALMIIGYYVRNAISGRMREGADSIGYGETYRPGSTIINKNTAENK